MVVKKVWRTYDEDVKKMVNLIEPELIALANGQKAILGESEETSKMLFKIISSEEAKKLDGREL